MVFVVIVLEAVDKCITHADLHFKKITAIILFSFAVNNMLNIGHTMWISSHLLSTGQSYPSPNELFPV